MRPPARVAIVIDSLLAGGAERVAVEVALALDPERFRPLVLASRQSGPLEAVLREGGVEYAVLGRRWGFAPAKLARALRLVRGCELVHAHKLEGAAWGALLARAARRPLVAHEHIWHGQPDRRRTLLYRWWIGPAAKRIVCVSRVVAESVVADGAPSDRIRLVPNGVRLDARVDRGLARAELGLPPDARVVGIVARLRPQKRHEALLRAAAILRSAGEEFLVCIVGDGERRSELEHLATELGVGDRVLFAGERPEAARLATAFDVSVICSSFEGLPLAGLEALAAGVPLVATAVSAMPELVEDGAGVLVPPGDDRALAAAIRELLADPTGARAIGARGRERVRERYTFERMVDTLESIYDEVIADATAGDPLAS